VDRARKIALVSLLLSVTIGVVLVRYLNAVDAGFQELRRTGTSISATVGDHKTYRLTWSFWEVDYTYAGVSYQGLVQCDEDRLTKGEQVTIFVDPADPTRFIITGAQQVTIVVDPTDPNVQDLPIVVDPTDPTRFIILNPSWAADAGLNSVSLADFLWLPVDVLFLVALASVVVLVLWFFMPEARPASAPSTGVSGRFAARVRDPRVVNVAAIAFSAVLVLWLIPSFRPLACGLVLVLVAFPLTRWAVGQGRRAG
jgi:hypothetical protein